ncbi:hypothetical protein F4678DRAFT_431016 [Xylaria arbuscula]|nr:hypothetical protein F4678DRAFT_431016 [Xylaria arbuscula]
MPNPKVQVPLGVLDHFLPPHYLPMSWYLPLKEDVSAEEAFAALEAGLRQTFKQVPWLSGKIYKQPPTTQGWRPGQLEIRYDQAILADDDAPVPHFKAKILPLTDDSMSYEDIRESGYPMDAIADEDIFWGEFLTVPEEDEGAECFRAQANFIPGAVILCGACHHNACDGIAAFDVWRLWAANCDALQSNTAPGVPDPLSSDRSLIERIWAEESNGSMVNKSDANLTTYSLLDMKPPNAPEAAPSAPARPSQPFPKEPMQSAVFYISSENFSALHKRCVDEAGAATHISGNDSMTALIWRSALKARHAAAIAAGRTSESEDAEAHLQLTLDGRPDISAKGTMPFVYMGNLVFWNRCAMPLSKLTAPETSTAKVALFIRTVAEAATAQTMLDAYGLARRLENLGRLQLTIPSPLDYDMILSSLITLRTDDIKWGGRVFAKGGKPDALQPLFDAINTAGRLCFPMPRKAGGGVEIVLNLYQDELDLLLEDEEFGEYAVYM